jgi:tetratricopeptide (TPR) repeat protein
MKTSISSLSCIFLFLLMPLQELSAQHEHMHDNQPATEETSIGEINFGVDCSDEVRTDFDHALGMLHHMMYAASRENFNEITEVAPQCAMAYWGAATTLFQPLWGTRPSQNDLKQGWQQINKALELVDSNREKLLIESTAAFFREPETADFRTRIQRWADAMEVAYNSYSGDLDIAALYGLTRLALAQYANEPAPLLDEAETILRDVFEESSTHPGAIHYTIHATDIDGRAENALDIVEAYGKIAPAVPHALHMPTHIYVRLGDWANVIQWNLRSAEAALNHPVNGAESHHYLHAVDYLVYAYLQRGQDQKAEKIYSEALKKDKYQGSFVSAFHLAAIPARLAVERRNWEQAASLDPRTPDYLPWDASPWAEGLTWYAKGLGAVHSGDIESAKKAEKQLVKLRDRAKENGADNMATYIEIDRRVLKGWIAHAEGRKDKAVELMRSAADLEDSVEKHPVTPGALQPSNEALGDLLLKLNRPAEALEAYKASENLWPGRLHTLVGAALAARMIGEEQVARVHIGKLLNNGRELKDATN